jgi:hypothetical protein
MATAQTETKKTPDYSRKTLRKMGRVKRMEKLAKDPEFKKAFFEGRAKRSADKKLAYRKRYAKK